MGLLSGLTRLAAGEKPSVGGLLSRAGLLGAGIGGGAWLMSPEEERVSSVSYQRDPEIDKSRSRVAMLQSDLATFDNGSAEDIQKALDKRGFDLGPTGVDGKLGEKTKAAIREYRAQTAAELEIERKRLADLEALDTKLSGDATKQAAFEATAPGGKQELLREFGWIPATLGAVALGKMTRGGAVKKVLQDATKKAAAADARLMPGVAVTRGSKANLSPKGLTSRASNLNEFWRMGGADEAVPFTYSANSGWKARPKAMEPAQLFPEDTRMLRGGDYGMMGTGVGEAGLSGVGWMAAETELKQAQEAVDKEPSEANLARLQRAQDMVALTSTMFRVGLGFAAGRGFGALNKPYATVRPNVAGAEAERALLLDTIRGAKP